MQCVPLSARRQCRYLCVVSEQQIPSANSRAHENGIFCTKKCEIEAKFWLLDRLKEPAPNTEDSAELSLTLKLE